ncbi:MAG: MFS transporter [Solobacterium sp.]|nr:MFS transporter [Solobacterium sp.]
MQESKQTILMKCCICIGGSVGLISNSFGIFYSPIAEEMQLGIGRISIMATIISLASAVFLPVFSRLMKRVKMNHLMVMGVLLASAAYLVMSWIHDIRVYYLCSVFLGIGAVCFSNFPVSILLKEWYGDRNGSALGIALAFSGLAGALANPLIGKLITGSGYELSMRLIAVFLLVTCFPASLTVHRAEEVQDSGTQGSNAVMSAALPLSLLVLIIVTTSSFNAVNGLNSHMSALAIDSGYSLEFSGFVVSAVMIANMTFKIIFGFIADRISVTRTIRIYMTLCTAGIIALLFMRTVPVILMIGAALYATDFSNSTIGGPLIMQKIAKDRYSEVYPKVAIFNTLSYALMTSAYGLLKDASGSYTLPLIVAVTICAGALVLNEVLGKHMEEETA